MIEDALQAWVEHQNKAVEYVMKGQNCRVEMFSAVKAEVEDPLDPSTRQNDAFLDHLKVADRVSRPAKLFATLILFAGACVRTSVVALRQLDHEGHT